MGSGLDFAVHHRLGIAGIVGFVVALTAVADDIDHHVAFEALAVFVGELRGAHAGFRIVAIDVENGRQDRERDVGAIDAAAAFERIGGETDLVVGDDVDGAAGFVAFQLRKLEHFGDDALANESGIAVNQNGQNARAFGVFQTILLGANETFDHRIDRFQMAWIEGDGDDDFASVRRSENAAGAEVILHVAGTLDAIGIRFAVEFGEDLRHRFADDVGEDVEAAAVSHADDGFGDIFVGGAFENFVERDDGAFQAFQAETLLADETGLQEMFEFFGLNEAIEHAAADGFVQLPSILRCFHAFLQPLFLLRVGNMHVLDADGAAVGGAEAVENGAEWFVGPHVAGDGTAGSFQGAGEEDAVEIPDGQAVGGGIEIGMIAGDRCRAGLVLASRWPRVRYWLMS